MTLDQGRVILRTLNLDGDGQGDLSVHGGVDKAVYAYSIENYRYWQQQLDRNDFVHGQLGENFTVEGMPEEQLGVRKKNRQDLQDLQDKRVKILTILLILSITI